MAMFASPRTSIDSCPRSYAFPYLCVCYCDSLFSFSCLEPCIPMQGLERIFACFFLFDLCDLHRQDVLRVISMTTVSSTANFTPYLLLISYVLLSLLYHLIALRVSLPSRFLFPWSLYSLMVVYSFRIFVECGLMTAALG